MNEAVPAAGSDQVQEAGPGGEPAWAQELGHRRQMVGVSAARRPWALAFSGGGIRSATFCLGLARALAANRVFEQFDYLSTVSGGGYVGAAIGRLYSQKAQAPQVSEGLADDRSLFLWWLRSNGRYLIPAGLADTLRAVASYLRGTLATHIEVGVLALLLGGMVMLPHVLLTLLGGTHLEARAFINPWWALLPVPAFLAVVSLAAFWFARENRRGVTADALWCVICLLISAGLLYAAVLSTENLAQIWPWIVTALVLAALGLGFASRCLASGKSLERVHHLQTRWFSRMMGLFFAVAAIGAVDLLTWSAAYVCAHWSSELFGILLGAIVALVAGIRAAGPSIQKLGGQPAGSAMLMPLVGAGGVVLTVLTVILWVTLAQWFVYYGALPPDLGPVVAALDSLWGRWLLLVGVTAVYVLLTGRNAEQVNRSSLHHFYRARLARAYVSVGNSPDHVSQASAQRRFDESPLARVARSNTQEVGKVSELLAHDDVCMKDYAPERYGGPVHLINCCINQTIDDRTGNFNADRKGVNLTVSSLGVELGTRHAHAEDMEEIGDTSLSQWVAISGAAAAPGMGSSTRFGVSAVLFLCGVRLGYWWTRVTDGALRDSVISKYSATLREWFGKFPGLSSSPLFVSDGGHFDNTGLYTLLKRRPELMVAADCGADPHYLFGDIENLVRKARIDYDITIEFIDPQCPVWTANPAIQPYVARFGTPDSICAQPGSAYLLLARVRYDDGSMGAIVFVKPRRIEALSLDVAGYSDRDRDFPQQSTGDQFFDEAQWESYCELGKRLGLAIDQPLLALIPAMLQGHTAKTGNLSGETAAADGSTASSRRERFAVTVGKTLGAGALLSALVAGWQIWDGATQQWQTQRNLQIAAVDDLLKDSQSELARAVTQSDSELTTFVSRQIRGIERIGDLYGSTAQREVYNEVLSTVYQTCLPIVAPLTETPETALSRSRCSLALAVLSNEQPSRWDALLDRYWAPRTQGGVQAAECRPALAQAPRLVIHARNAMDRQVQAVRNAAVRLGLNTEIIEHGGGAGIAELAGDSVHFAAPMLLWMLGDAQCSDELQQHLPARLADSLRAINVPGFSYVEGTLNLWIPDTTVDQTPLPVGARLLNYLPGDQDPSQMFAPEAAAGPASGSIQDSNEAATSGDAASGGQDASASTARSEPQRYVVYIQFRGLLSRETIDRYRQSLASRTGADGMVFAVPQAERLAGQYNSMVKYFRPENQAAAEALATSTNDAMSAAGCRFKAPIRAISARGKAPENSLEVWINADDCVKP